MVFFDEFHTKRLKKISIHYGGIMDIEDGKTTLRSEVRAARNRLEKLKDERRRAEGVTSIVGSIMIGGTIGLVLVWIISMLFDLPPKNLYFLPILGVVGCFIKGFSIKRKLDRSISELSGIVQKYEDKMDRL